MARTRDMTTGSPTRHLILFTLPIMAGNIFQQLYSLVDSFVVGQVSVDALTAVASAGWLDWLILSIAMGLSQGFSIQVAQSFGAGNRAELRRALGQSILISVVTVAALMVIALTCLWPMLVLLDMPAQTIHMTESYLRILFIGMPVVMGYNLLAGFLRSVGNSVIPLVAMVAASIANIVLDLLFVLSFGWGVEGAAIATLCGQGLSLVICLVEVLRTQSLHIGRRDLNYDRRMCARLMRLGLPIAFQNLIISVGGLVLQRVVNGFRYAFVAGFNAAGRLGGLMQLAGGSLSSAVGTFAGQNLGAGRLDRVKQGMRRAAQLCVAMGVIVAVLMIIFGEALLGLFVTDVDPVKVEQTMEVAYLYLVVMSVGLPMLYLLFAYRTTLQGIGDTFIPMISGVVELAMRILCSVALPLVMGEWGIYVSEIAAWVGAAVLLMWGYYRRIHLLEKKMQ